VAEHGLADAAAVQRWGEVKITLTPKQWRLLRDLAHWAAVDIQEGPEDTFWSHIVPEGEAEWDEAVATMQEISDALDPGRVVGPGRTSCVYCHAPLAGGTRVTPEGFCTPECRNEAEA